MQLLHNKIFIQKATTVHYKEITAVWEASVRATHHFLKEKDIIYFKPLIEREYLHAMPVYFIQSDQGSIAGFLGVAAYKIEMLFIHPDYRGKGLGQQLLQYALNILQASQVDVNEQNEQAVGFYKKAGFKIVSRSPVDGSGKPYPILHMEMEG